VFDVKAPISVFGVDGRYAHALYSAAVKEKKLESVEKELKAIQVCCPSTVEKQILQFMCCFPFAVCALVK